MITRRNFVLAGTAATVACRKRRGDGYAGYAFVANEEGHAIAAVDLTAFAVSRHIRLEDAPTAVAAHPTRATVYALTPRTGVLYEVNAGTLSVTRKLAVIPEALSMRMDPAGKSIWVLGGSRRRLVRVELEPFRVEENIALPETPTDFDLAQETGLIGVSYGGAHAVSLVDLAERRTSPLIRLEGDAGVVRFRSDGRSLLVANTSARLLTVLDAPSGRVVVHLPLSIRPDNFCFNRDGGQLFITGEGRDAVVVVYPYYVPEVAETVLAGSRPGAMAASAQHLFVVNPSAGDVSILSILRRKVIAVTAVGAEPAYVTLTPDDEYALILNRKSGDMAVLRIQGLQPDRRKSAALFTMIPVGSKPVGAVVKAV